MRTSLIAAVAGSLLASTAAPALAASPNGTWVRPSTGTKAAFYDCVGKLCAQVVGVKDPAKKGTIGTVIMGGAKKAGANRWDGDLLNTDNGNVYSGHVTLWGAGLELQGCALAGLVCQRETWKRAD